jgi:hypothetical protein
MKLNWRMITRNCHVGYLDDQRVVTVERPQKNRPDGTKHDWRIEVLGDRYTGIRFDPQDLESTKSSAEKRLEWAIEQLFRKVKQRDAHRSSPRK